MADAETEAEWAKMRRVAKEKEKAAKALEAAENAKSDEYMLTYLDPRSSKTKGFSSNRETIIRAVEKFSNYSIIFVVMGTVLNLIARAGLAVTSVNHLGAAGAIISGLPQAIGTILLYAGIASAVTGILSSIYVKIKFKTNMQYTFSTSVGALLIFGIYELIWYNI